MTTARNRPAIDPRIRERRIEVTRREGRRRLRILVAAVVAIVVFAGAAGATRSNVLDVDHIVVAGLGHTTPAQVVHAARLERHRLMVDVHADAVSRSIKRLPWIASAHVERVWPATVRITVRERSPVASVPAPGGWALADRFGRILARQPQPAAGVPQISGGTARGRVGTQVPGPVLGALRAAAAMPAELRPKVPDVAITPNGLELRLLPRGVAVIGSVAQLDAKLDAVITMLAKVDVPNLAVLDVRVPSAPVLTRG